MKGLVRLYAILILTAVSLALPGCGAAMEKTAGAVKPEEESGDVGSEEPGVLPSDEKQDRSEVNPERTGSGPEVHGQLRVEKWILTDRDGESFQLRGMSTHGIGWFPDYINAGAMKSVKEAGGNVMRIAMYTQADRGYLSEPDRSMMLVKQAVENARAMDMYVIVDWHILDDGDPNAHLDRAITFFDAVASLYPKDPAILYEVCNEPNGVNWDRISEYAYAICPVIRQYSPEAVIILGTPDYSSDIGSPTDKPFPGENILYAYHYYAGEHGGYSALKKALKKKLPLFVSEWGIGKDGSGEPALKEGEEFADFLNENSLSWCAWSLCNKDEVYSALKPDCDKLSAWGKEDLTEVGKVMFSAMGGKAP